MTTEAEAALSQELRFHRRMARPGIFIDVGAHKGDFVFGMVGVAGLKAVAIEPLPYAFHLLQQRVSQANQPIRLINAALSDGPGTCKLQVPVLSEGGPVWEWASMTKDFARLQADFPEIAAIQSFDVPILTLDSLDLGHVSALKVDAEGAEYEILSGARAVLTDMRPVVSAELEERHRAGCTYSVPAFMDALDYACFFEVDEKFLPFATFDRASMQQGSPSPASHEYSKPYVNCFYFLPRERSELFARIGVAPPVTTTRSVSRKSVVQLVKRMFGG